MVFKGEVGDVGLAEVFQMLAASGKEGTLTVASGNRKIHIWFGKGKMRVLRDGGVSHTAIGKMLLRAGKITAEQLSHGLQEQKNRKTLLGEALVALGYVTTEEVDDCVRAQLEEEICNVFLWDDARFEFTPGPPEAVYADTQLAGKEVPFGVNEVLLEATRRVDEWSKVMDEIERTRAEFEVAQKGELRPEDFPMGFGYGEVKEVVDLIGRVRRVDEIVGRAPMNKLEVARVLVFLLRSGYIRKVERSPDAEPTAPPPPVDWRVGMAVEIDDAELKKRVETILWSAETKRRAVDEMVSLADGMIREGRLDDTVPLYRLILDIDPDNQIVRTKLVHLCVLQWKFAEAAKVLVEGYRRTLPDV